MCVYIYIHTYTHVYVYTYIFIYMYICVHTYTYVHINDGIYLFVSVSLLYNIWCGRHLEKKPIHNLNLMLECLSFSYEVNVQPIPLGVTFSKAQSSKFERLFCHISVKEDVRTWSFELWNSIRTCHPKCDWL